MSIHTVLVANRGEIACRVIRTVRAMGLRSVAVHSDADATAPHVKLADRAVAIGPAPVNESYLRIDAIVQAALDSGANAIHPGYGFLSENCEFARACEAAGLIFIGPGTEAIEIMGNKAESKRRMLAAGVPCIPGYEDKDQTDARLIEAAERIAYPIMVKAAAGGGGRGMRLVQQASELPGALQRARSEALNAFGSDELILERAVMNPRHVELQIFADQHGNAIHLGERDCSVQRRHQKVLEEAPCPVMTAELRNAMGEAAVQVARSVNYCGAGTVEFLLDADNNFYFLEMNTRLQVEHPVTEMVTGLDLVEWQIRVAQGEALPCSQAEIQLNGHAIEARLYCEDPEDDFLPATGHVDLWKPATGAGIRIDAGIGSGFEVSPFYDPMVAKLIAHGPTRDIARKRLIAALKGSILFGPKTNKAFLIAALEHEEFAAGQATTAFIGDHFAAITPQTRNARIEALAAITLHQLRSEEHFAASPSRTRELLNWTSGLAISHSVQFASEAPVIRITPDRNTFQIQIGDMAFIVDRIADPDDGHIEARIDGESMSAVYNWDGRRLWLAVDGYEQAFEDLLSCHDNEDVTAGSGDVRAPMHGVVLDVRVEIGQSVRKGQSLLVMEAMKMQHELLSGADGEVEEIRVQSGQQVASNDLLIRIRSSED